MLETKQKQKMQVDFYICTAQQWQTVTVNVNWEPSSSVFAAFFFYSSLPVHDCWWVHSAQWGVREGWKVWMRVWLTQVWTYQMLKTVYIQSTREDHSFPIDHAESLMTLTSAMVPIVPQVSLVALTVWTQVHSSYLWFNTSRWLRCWLLKLNRSELSLVTD